MKRMRQPLILLMFLLASTATMAQDDVVRGTVKSATDNEPLIGVSVVLKGTAKGVVTDFDGNYELKGVNKGQTLVFSYIGYTAKEVAWKGQRTLDIFLNDDQKLLDEVVVVGYGVMKRSDITGSVVSIGEEDMKKSVITTVDQALQGRAAGVQVTQNSGAPGGGISVNIRGLNSLNGNEPLYVVDGIAIEGGTNSNTNALASINPADITSMEVLKDASATAIYGSKASNGVVLITTKKGQAGKTKIAYDGYVAWQQLPKKLDVLNLCEYAEFANLRTSVYPDAFPQREEFMDPSVLGTGTDWQDEIFRTALMHNHQLNVSGGSEQTKYSVSLGYQDQDGIAYGTGFNRFSARINLDSNFGKWLHFGVNSSLARTKQENAFDDTSVLSTAVKQLPDTPAKNPDGSYGTQQENMYGAYFHNPLADAMLNENYRRGTQVLFNAYADVKFYKDLVLRVEYGGNLNYDNQYTYVPKYDTGYSVQQSNGSRTASNNSYMTFKTYLTYTHDFGKHGLNVMAGHEAQESNYESLYGSRTDYLFNNIHELPAGDATTAKNSSNKGSSSIESYYGRLNYNYDNRYLLTATLRADGSSSFGPNNRWGWFPSVALAWRAKQEKFLEKVDWLNDLKIRLGWGLVGNQWAGSFSYSSAMASTPTVWGTGFYSEQFANPDLKWEQTSSWNAGIDLSLFKNRIELIFDIYKKKTDNLLMPATLPNYVTDIINAPYVNAGSMENKGFEFTLNTVNVNKGGFLWKTGITFSLNRNKVLELTTESAGMTGEIGGKTYTYTVAGQPAAQFYGYRVIGMFNSEEDLYQKDKNGDYLYDAQGNRKMTALPEGKSFRKQEVWYGDFIFEDINGDGVINEKDVTFIGNPEPKFSYGITNNFSYKNFDLSVFITGVYGGNIYNYMRQEFTQPKDHNNMLSDVANIARLAVIDTNVGDDVISNVYVSNPGATVQRLSLDDANQNNRTSTRFVESGSYLRVKNISLGYTFPRKWISKWGIENLRIYCNIQNPFTITDYSGYDPEIGSYNQSVLKRNIDYARYPSQRIYTFGLNINL